MLFRFTDRFRVDKQRPFRKGMLLFAAIALFSLELYAQLEAGVEVASWPAIVVTAGMSLAIGLIGLSPIPGGLMYIVLYLAAMLVPFDIYVVHSGIFIVVLDWVAAGWFGAAAGLLLVGLTTDYLMLPETSVPAWFMFTFVATAASVAIGLIVRRSQVQVDNSREVAREEIHRDLAVELHKTVARDLGRVIVARELLGRDPSSPAAMEQIQVSAREALRSTRSMMERLARDEGGSRDAIDQVIARCKKMLDTRSIRLNVEIPDGADEGLTNELSDILTLALKEGSSNILNYAPAESEADLVMERQSSGSILLTFSNVYSQIEEGGSLLSGGFGLRNLTVKVHSLGGHLSYRVLNRKWILLLELPLPKVLPQISEE